MRSRENAVRARSSSSASAPVRTKRRSGVLPAASSLKQWQGSLSDIPLTLRDLQCGGFKLRDTPTRQDRLHLLAAALFRSQPGLDVLGSQINDASIMTRGCHIRWRVIRDGRKTT